MQHWNGMTHRWSVRNDTEEHKKEQVYLKAYLEALHKANLQLGPLLSPYPATQSVLSQITMHVCRHNPQV